METYPIDATVQEALSRFQNIDSMLDKRSFRKASRDKREIIRVLGTAYDPGIDQLLRYIDENICDSGDIGKQLLNRTDPLQFRQHLAELYLLVFSRTKGEAEVTPATRPKSGKSHDIDIRHRDSRARIEVTSPVDFYGYQFVMAYVEPLFRYSLCKRGFNVNVVIKFKRQDGYHAYDVPRAGRVLDPWLKRLRPNVTLWLDDAAAGSSRRFAGIDESFHLKATLEAVNPNPACRRVIVKEPTRSTDTRLFFEERSPSDVAESQIGRKIWDKMVKRQCGDQKPGVLRILVVNFRHADTYHYDWFWWPEIADRIDATIKILADCCGETPPYDVVLPAKLNYDCCFGRSVVLDAAKAGEAAEMIGLAGFDVRCKPQKAQAPPRELVDALNRLPAEQKRTGSGGDDQFGIF